MATVAGVCGYCTRGCGLPSAHSEACESVLCLEVKGHPVVGTGVWDLPVGVGVVWRGEGRGREGGRDREGGREGEKERGRGGREGGRMKRREERREGEREGGRERGEERERRKEGRRERG